MSTSTAACPVNTSVGQPWLPSRRLRVGINDHKLDEKFPVNDPFSVLSDNVRAELKSRWRRPCEEVFAHLALSHPDELLVLIEKGGMPPSDLTYAAEVAGCVPGSERVLFPLLAHGSAVVREGAVYGLAGQLTPRVRGKLAQLASRDHSPGVRAAAADVLAP